MLLNYHELTMDESRDSPARRKQFRLICAVMVTCLAYAVVTSGVLRPVEVDQGIFPGGEFIFKYTARDYAASMSLLQNVAGDLKVKEKEYGHVMYNLFLDDPLVVNGRRQRFASGILLNENTMTSKHTSNEERKRVLIEMNDEIKDPTETELQELPAYELWKRLKYQALELPNVKAAEVTFPFTNGFVSALVHSYKVFPALRDYAKKHGDGGITPVILTTCNITHSKCTHYAPLSQVDMFRMGTEEQASDVINDLIDWDGVKKTLLKIVTFGQRNVDLESQKKADKVTRQNMKEAPKTDAEEAEHPKPKDDNPPVKDSNDADPVDENIQNYKEESEGDKPVHEDTPPHDTAEAEDNPGNAGGSHSERSTEDIGQRLARDEF